MLWVKPSVIGSWLKTILVLMMLLVGLSKGEGENATDAGLSESFNPRMAVGETIQYLTVHPDYVAAILTWLAVGCVLWLLGIFVFIFSEISAVLICRDQDFRIKLVQSGRATVRPGVAYEKLIAREKAKLEPRPYLSLCGMAVMFLGLCSIFFSICDITDLIGLPAAPCLLFVIFGSFAVVICNVTFLMFLIWSCTRSWAALVFFLISFAGLMMLPYGNPILYFIWLILSLGGGYAYFFYLPITYNAAEIPPWVQNVGLLSIEFSTEKVKNAFVGAIKVTLEEGKEKFEEAKRASEAAIEKARKDAEDAAKKVSDSIPGAHQPPPPPPE